MATDSEAKLTKYKSAVTVVTADFANSIFGGLYGSSEADLLADDDPRVLGHVHDGGRADGHAPKVHLVEHVTDQLTNPNLADDAVMKRNVWDTINQEKAIPELRVEGTKTYYYLDLRHVRNDFVFQEDQDPAGDGSQNKNIRQRYTEFDGTNYIDIPGIWNGHSGYDFVFGSPSLDDLNLTHDEGESRFQFDKSNASFRAGSASSDQWDEPNRGSYSVGFGSDNRATGDYSATLGGLYNEANDSHSVVGGGFNNKADAKRSVISGGESNKVAAAAETSVVSGGASNEIWNKDSVISGGGANKIYSEASVISGGVNSEIQANSEYSAVAGGFDHYIGGKYSSVSGGYENIVEADYSHVSGGEENRTGSDNTSILGGYKNIIDIGSSKSVIVGGSECEVAQDSKFSLVYGSANKVGSAVSPATYSLSFGGENNAVDSSYSSIIGGKGNYIDKSSDYTHISGGQANSLIGTGSTIIQANNSRVEGEHSTLIGGIVSNVTGNYNIVAGPGEYGAPLNIGIGYKSKTGRDMEDSPSHVSGIFGGESCNIVGGSKSDSGILPNNNYILGSPYSQIGAAIENLHVTGCGILGSTKSEISAQPIDRPNVHRLLYSNIFGGYDNFILMGNQPDITEVLYTGIIGGFRNSINIRRDGRPNTPWYQGSPYEDVASEFGVQTSYILGGSQNLITNSEEALFEKNSLLSTIVGGNKNIISSSYGSTILGGGMFPNVRSGQDKPPYADTQYYHSNVISSAHSSSILNGSSNHIATIEFPFNEAGVFWNAAGKGDRLFLPEPAFCIAEGRESCSYLYGQKAYSTGGHHRHKFESQGFLSGAAEHTYPSQTEEFYFTTILGGLFDSDTGEPKEVPGTAQTSVVNFYGSFNYNSSEIQDPATGLFNWLPASNTWFEFRAYLDGSRDTALSPWPAYAPETGRCFIPRYIGSYSFTIKGHLRYTDILTSVPPHPPGGPDEIGHNHMVSFTYNGYVIFQPDGSGFYGGELKDVISSDVNNPVVLDLMEPAGLQPGTDFYFAFCPEWDLASGAATDPTTAYNDSKGRGYWPTPNFTLSYGPKSWPPQFSIYVINNTAGKALTGHGSMRELIGESLVAKAEITEDLLFLGKYDKVT